jgi:hypothetical protein
MLVNIELNIISNSEVLKRQFMKLWCQIVVLNYEILGNYCSGILYAP